MAAPYAFATLLTSDFYLPGALALAAALKDVHPTPAIPPEVEFQTVCLVTPETVDVSTIKLLRKAYDVVIGVEVIAQEDDKGLKLLGRPDLNTVLTKLHVFRLTQYSKIIFMDADVLPIWPLSHLFSLPHEFSAVPDVGWPDIFNSGVMVLSPGEDKFTELNTLFKSKGSWDGGDQGLLNEWRGGDWNRLSFTYNTTPTAAYTYAPAYERFGSQIKAIHFIGPNKPWNLIPHRPPFSGKADSSPVTEFSQAYDYTSLLDRWFYVYDTYYRSQSIVPEAEFEVKRYTSAWDEQSGAEAEAVSVVSSIVPTSALGLEDLKRLALEGMSVVPSDNRSGEGDYKSMPLEGRVDLMRPRPEPQEAQREATIITREPQAKVVPSTSVQSDDFPTYRPPPPAPSNIPPSSHPQSIPLQPIFSIPPPQLQADDMYHEPSHPPGNLQADIVYHEPTHPLDDLQSDITYHEPPRPLDQHEQLKGQEQSRLEVPSYPAEAPKKQTQRLEQRPPPRPVSPPKVAWNPAIEPPPTTAPASSVFPSDTYFPNVWDQRPSKLHDQARQYRAPHQQPSSPTPDSGAFFQPPPTPEIPESLRKQGHYRQVTGDDHLGLSPSPDRSKVKPVFPWEEQPRHMPGRVFPASDAPSPSQFLSPVSEEPLPLAAPFSPPFSSRSQTLSPLQGLPASLTYANAWDTVPSIQKYASRLVRSPVLPLAPAFESDDWRRRGGRSWDDRTEASSRDGDDEDNADDDDEAPAQSLWAEDSDNETHTSKARSRGSSVSSGYVSKAKKKEYRVRGVQTISPEMRSQGVQVDTISQSPSRSTDKLGSTRKQWAPLSVATPSAPVVVSQVSGGPELSMTTTYPSPAGGMRSPREYAFPDTPGTARAGKEASAISPPPRQAETGSPSIARQLSHDGSSLASPPSSVGPLSPPDSQPFSVTSPRKPGRVFDPARGVEVFKRGSEEVLARFLKMSSWEE
ncbi:glycogenin [Desarmillaria tabescens]|uniref:glycogenin glucosyltransferase n=1 Tax=Armillaria tabescens TaxID=1929756 RepID=A0AA39NHM1_ARMTA|nr:glycogenin [Desarmillaria tabescens]KAK0465623.1 glycogenin [Desarmillaria tabescens]